MVLQTLTFQGKPMSATNNLDDAAASLKDLIISLEESGKITTVQGDILLGVISDGYNETGGFVADLTTFLQYPVSSVASWFYDVDSSEQVKAFYQYFYDHVQDAGVSPDIIDDVKTLVESAKKGADSAQAEGSYVNAATEQAKEQFEEAKKPIINKDALPLAIGSGIAAALLAPVGLATAFAPLGLAAGYSIYNYFSKSK